MTEWINASKELPKENQDAVFVSKLYNTPHYGTYKNGKFVIYYHQWEFDKIEVVRWYPVPKPYK